jgi:glyoxylase-like metal-dependent hydrolase (beta-lactamase superfamily II)
MALALNRSFEAPYGVAQRLSPLAVRLLAPNPGIFTFRGTGVYILGAGGAVMVVDPGPALPAHLEALRRVLEGRRVSHILVTHTHLDHSPAARFLKDWSGAKIHAFGPHPVSSIGEDGVAVEEGGDVDFAPDLLVKDGDILEGDGFSIECVFTPGHTSNHMCYALREEKALFSGDHVMGWSTSVVVPPDGDMRAYRQSLARLLTRDDALYYPTHGAPVAAPQALVRDYLEHRQAREDQILACLAEGLDRIPQIVTRLYDGVDRRLHPAAARSVLAHLIELTGDGRVLREGDHYRLA